MDSLQESTWRFRPEAMLSVMMDVMLADKEPHPFKEFYLTFKPDVLSFANNMPGLTEEKWGIYNERGELCSSKFALKKQIAIKFALNWNEATNTIWYKAYPSVEPKLLVASYKADFDIWVKQIDNALGDLK